MIWLRKKRNNASNGNTSHLAAETVAFDEYVRETGGKKVDDDLQRDISFKMFQLIDIFSGCMIIYEWLIQNRNENKHAIIEALKSTTCLSRILVPTNHCMSQQEYNDLGEETRGLFERTHQENISDIVEREFSEVDLSFLKDFTDHEETKVKKEGLIMNAMLTQGLWSALRILPRDNAPVAIMRYRGGEELPVLGFIDKEIFRIDKNETPYGQAVNLRDLLLNAGNESLSFFFELSKIYLKTKDRLSKKSVIREKYSFPSEYEEESFLGLLENKDYRIISDCVREFEDYCYKFISRGYLEYKDNILQIRKRSDGKDTISQYYLINLLFDKNYELAKAQKIIKDNYARLIGKKISQMKENLSGSATGYLTEIKNILA